MNTIYGRLGQRWLGGVAVASVATGASMAACTTGPAETTPMAASQCAAQVANAPLVVDLVVDANRDGVADPQNPDDQKHGNEFDAKFGASALANLDDDDGDKVRDADDTVVNGADDEKDLARIRMAPSPTVPDDYTAEVELDKEGANNFRVFRRNADGTWTLVAGVMSDLQGDATFGNGRSESDACDDCQRVTKLALTAADLRAGIEFGVESRRFRATLDTEQDAWDGTLHVSVAAFDGQQRQVGKDQVVVRVAPWVLHGNTSTFDRVRSAAFYSKFVADLKKALVTNAKVDYLTYKSASGTPKGDAWNDQWTQDLYQTGWTAMPGPNGTLQGMRVGNARPWGRSAGNQWLPINWLRSAYLGPDQAIASFYQKANTGSTYDSHGNHDLLPPYENGLDKFPLGRIIYGDLILPETAAFYEAQRVQGPALVVSTSWLAVGHVDEVLSYVPAKTPRGWKLLIGSNTRSRMIFEDLAKKGHGGVKFWTGFQNYDPKTDKAKDAETSVEETLQDADLLKWSQRAQINAGTMKHEVLFGSKGTPGVGLATDEIVEIPFLSEDVGGGSKGKPENKIAWQPGTVNSLVVGDHFCAPHPFGPVVDGKDSFVKDMEDRMGSPMHALGKDGKGLQIHPIDDFMSYHVAMGEVHCGTNPEGPPPAGSTWWTIGR
jgi:protein-arginine deiminase